MPQPGVSVVFSDPAPTPFVPRPLTDRAPARSLTQDFAAADENRSNGKKPNGKLFNARGLTFYRLDASRLVPVQHLRQ